MYGAPFTVAARTLNARSLTTTSPRPNPVEALADTHDQTENVLIQLDQRLAPAGLFGHWLTNTAPNGRRSDAVSGKTLEQTWRGHLARRGIELVRVGAD